MTHTETPTNTAAPTLVLGSSGKIGSRVARALDERGVPVRLGGRRGEPPFDWQDRATWPAALDGVRSVFLLYAPDLGTTDSVADIAAFTERAAAAGVERIVQLSARLPDEGRTATEGLMADAEAAVRKAGPDWTILRAGWFFQNFDEGFLSAYVRAGTLALPTAEGREFFVDAGDIAEVAAVALTEGGHAGRTYELTGARGLTFGEAVAEIASAADRRMDYLPLAEEEFGAALTAEGFPAETVALVGDLLRRIRLGGLDHGTDDVRTVLGRAPRDFADFVKDASANGSWRA
ncbi:NAD(P)H-binding protein [Streptomyces alkaliterrae]|uniref:NAD(P)H-binding protein n=1 Tax=Streptomyces alkaliterrae TaxID=2213162 RepID=A0A5P0YJ55_9ACTN|nr:NAD(P)H-binding protein [Streptomyces alkaliterrae]MBB1257467.1 NAD(P)H-binding protein [Streptomyces alkaliterrae]MQS00356.1 NAD(P)H-binding protein [Streptomyces alkaliterrae]